MNRRLPGTIREDFSRLEEAPATNLKCENRVYVSLPCLLERGPPDRRCGYRTGFIIRPGP